MRAAEFADDATVKIVAGIELQAGLVGVQLHGATGLWRFDRCGEAQAVGFAQAKIVIVAAAALQLRVGIVNARADRVVIVKIEWRAGDGSRRAGQRNAFAR